MRARYEQHGAGFAPFGGLGVIADRRLAEGFATLRVNPLRGRVDLRVQAIENGWDSAAIAVDTVAWGAAYRGAPLPPRPQLKLHLRADGNDIEADSGDRGYRSYGLGIGDRLLGRLRWDYDLRHDRVGGAAGSGDRRRTDHALYLTRDLGPGGGLRVRAGLVRQRQRRGAAYTGLRPALDVSGAWDRHDLELHLEHFDQDFAPAPVADLRSTTTRLRYQLAHGAHTFRASVEQLLRRPDGARKTDVTRLALAYSYRFVHTGGR